MISENDPRYKAAQDALEAMHRFWKLHPEKGAVQWIEDTEGRVIIFTRGEYRDKMMNSINENMQDVEMFSLTPNHQKD